MFEETNQAEMEMENDGSDLFLQETGEAENTEREQEQGNVSADLSAADSLAADSLVADSSAYEEDEKPSEADNESSADKSAQKESSIRVKFNGQEKDIPVSEATILAQKGMNYDKVAKERDELKNSDELRELDLWAKQSGMTRQEFVKILASQREEALIATALQDVQDEYGNISDKAALEIAKIRAAQKQEQYESNAAKAQAAAQEDKLKPWSEFVQRYPNIKEAKDLPPTVLNDMANGLPPVEAMQRYELAELTKQLAELNKKQAAETKNYDNKQKSTGSAASKGAETRPDAFFMGFDD